MARKQVFQALTAAIRAPFSKRFGLGANVAALDYAQDNGFRQLQSNAANTADIEVFSVDANNNLILTVHPPE